MDKIAEGFERNRNLEFRQFLSIAKESAGKSIMQLYRVFYTCFISGDKFSISNPDFENLNGKVNNFISYLKKKDFRRTKFQ